MNTQKHKPGSWAPLAEVLPQSLDALAPGRHDTLEWHNLHWRWAVGADLAVVSEVIRVQGGEVHVALAGREWLTAFQALEHRILDDWNKRADCAATRLQWTIRKTTHTGTIVAPGVPSAAVKPDAAPQPQTITEEHLETIRDDRLRATLARLGAKFARISIAWVCALALAGCATLSTGEPEAKRAGKTPTIDLTHSQAVRELKKSGPAGALTKDPRSYYNYILGLKADRENKFAEAARHLSEVVQYDPGAEEFYPRLARLQLRRGDLSESLAVALRGLQRFPKNAELHSIAGDILGFQEKRREAIDHYRLAAQSQPPDTRAMLLAGVLHAELDEKTQAGALFKQTADVEPGNPLAWYYLARAQIAASQHEAARESLEKAITLRPNFLNAREHMAWVLEKLQRFPEALEEYKTLLKLNPGNRRIQEYLQRTYNEAADATGRGDLLLEDTSVHMKIGTIYYEQAAYLNALDEFRLVPMREKEERAASHLIISRIFELVGQMEEAIVEMRALLAFDPGSVEILLQIARLHSLNDQLPQAVGVLEQSVALEPDNDQIHHSLSLAQMSVGRFDRAAAAIRRAIAINPNRDSYYFELGSILERTGKIDEAIANMKKTLELNPLHSNAHNFLGYIYSQQGSHLDEALTHLEKALSIQPRNGYFLDSLGWIYFRQGEYNKALEQMKKALVYTPPDPVLYDHLGDIHFQLKNYEDARKAWISSRSLTLMKKNSPNQELPDAKILDDKINKVTSLLQKPL